MKMRNIFTEYFKFKFIFNPPMNIDPINLNLFSIPSAILPQLIKIYFQSPMNIPPINLIYFQSPQEYCPN